MASARDIRRCLMAGLGRGTERCSGMTRGSSSDDPFFVVDGGVGRSLRPVILIGEVG